jgi:adenylate cyclase
LGGVYLLKKQYDQAVAEGERAITLNPNDAQSYFTLATTLNLVGKPKEALGLAEEAMRRDPRSREWHLWNVSLAYFLMGRIEEASTVLKRFLTRYPTHLSARLLMAVLYSASGREAEARAEAGEVLRLSPHFSLEWLRQMVPAKDPAGVEFALALLRKAGLK